MELNEEDQDEIQKDENMEINEQFVEACEHGAFGMAQSLLELGEKLIVAPEVDDVAVCHCPTAALLLWCVARDLSISFCRCKLFLP